MLERQLHGGWGWMDDGEMDTPIMINGKEPSLSGDN